MHRVQPFNTFDLEDDLPLDERRCSPADQVRVLGAPQCNIQSSVQRSARDLRAAGFEYAACSLSKQCSSSCLRAFVAMFFPELVFFAPSCLRGDVLSRIGLLRAFVPSW